MSVCVCVRVVLHSFLQRQPSRLRALECSLKDCYGLKELHNFINVPFAHLKISILKNSIRLAEQELALCMEETDLILAHQDYDQYTERMAAIAAANAESAAKRTQEQTAATHSPSAAATAVKSPSTTATTSEKDKKTQVMLEHAPSPVKSSKTGALTREEIQAAAAEDRKRGKGKSQKHDDVDEFRPEDNTDAFFSDDDDDTPSVKSKPVGESENEQKKGKTWDSATLLSKASTPSATNPVNGIGAQRASLVARGMLVEEEPDFAPSSAGTTSSITNSSTTGSAPAVSLAHTEAARKETKVMALAKQAGLDDFLGDDNVEEDDVKPKSKAAPSASVKAAKPAVLDDFLGDDDDDGIPDQVNSSSKGKSKGRDEQVTRDGRDKFKSAAKRVDDEDNEEDEEELGGGNGPNFDEFEADEPPVSKASSKSKSSSSGSKSSGSSSSSGGGSGSSSSIATGRVSPAMATMSSGSSGRVSPSPVISPSANSEYAGMEEIQEVGEAQLSSRHSSSSSRHKSSSSSSSSSKHKSSSSSSGSSSSSSRKDKEKDSSSSRDRDRDRERK